MLKKILTYFEMLIVPHALHCVDSCIFVFTSFDTVWHTVLVSVPALHPLPQNVFIRFSFFVKIHLLLIRELTVRVVGLPPPPFPKFIFILPFEKRSYYVIPLGVRPSVRLSVRPSVCKLFRFRVTPPTVYVRLS